MNHLTMEEETTLDEILNSGLRIFQAKKGYRFSLDAILLSHFASFKAINRVIDIGCGNGIILLILAKRYPNINLVGLEIQDTLARLARKNVEFNNLGNRIEIISGDARRVKIIFQAHAFDTAIFNPPYRKLNSGRINPLTEKAIARHEISGSLKDFLAAAKYLLKPSGTVFTIYPAKRLVELIALFRLSCVEPKRMRLIFSDNKSEAVFVLVEGKKSGREELKIKPPLFIYAQNKKYTGEMSHIFSELSHFPSGGGG